MRFSFAAVLAFAAAVIANADFDSVSTPAAGVSINAGSKFEIEWTVLTKVTGTVTIALVGGADAGSLQPVETLTTGYDNSLLKYSWNINPALGTAKAYGIKITLDSDPSKFSYSPLFIIKGNGSSSSSSASGTKSGDVTSTVTTATGTKTVSISSAPPKSTTATSSQTSNQTSTDSATTLLTTASPTESTPAASTTSSASKTASTGGAAAIGASSLAAVGGIVAALLAL